jgi:hypothetical protein
MLGTHDGPGAYGNPTGKRVSVMGISNYRLDDGKIIEKWTEFGELAFLQYLHRDQEMDAADKQKVQNNDPGRSSTNGSPIV